MPFNVNDAGFEDLRSEFARLESLKAGKIEEHTNAVTSFNESLGRFDAVFGKIEILEEMANRFISESPGKNPFEKDTGETVDDVLTVVTGVLAIGSAFGSMVMFGLSARKAATASKSLKDALKILDGAQDVLGATGRNAVTLTTAQQGAVQNAAKLNQKVGHAKAARTAARSAMAFAVVGAALAGFSIYNLIRTRNAELAFYRINIPKYEEWYSDTDDQIEKLNSNRDNLENELTALQTQFGYASYEEMERELNREIGRVAEYEAMYVTAQKMFCQTTLPVSQVENFTGLPGALLNRMEADIRPGGVPDGEFCEQFEVAS